MLLQIMQALVTLQRSRRIDANRDYMNLSQLR